MIIKLDGEDLEKIEEKLGNIRSAAMAGKMGQDGTSSFNIIITHANEILSLLHNGGLVTGMSSEEIRRHRLRMGV